MWIIVFFKKVIISTTPNNYTSNKFCFSTLFLKLVHLFAKKIPRVWDETYVKKTKEKR